MAILITLLRSRPFQRVWQTLHHASLVLMNYWASHVEHTGEKAALVELAASFPPNAILFDVGANVGDFVKLLQQNVPRSATIHAFEPSITAFTRLKEETGSSTNVKLNRAGLSDVPGRRTLHSDAFGSTIASLETLADPIRPHDAAFDEEVECTTLDAYCAGNHISRIDFLKMDVEGHELRVLMGARAMLDSGSVSVIQWEFGENNVSSRTFMRDFVELLSDYDLFRIVPGGLTPWRYQGGQSEIFATMNYVAVRKVDPATR